MKELPILVLLSSAVLLCSATPVLEQVTCSEDSGATAAHLAMHHINEHHHHGYKFRLNETRGYKVETVDNGCNVELQLDLLETKCHVVNPKQFEDCELRRDTERAVMANCTVMMTVKDSDAKFTKYKCGTRQVHTNREMVMMCPDCPTLVPLNDPEGLKSVHEAVKKFNQNTTNQHYFILQEVGRIRSAYMFEPGFSYFAEFVLVETHCPMGSRIMPEACTPLCPDRARHAFCRSSYSTMNGLQSVECDFYPPSNTTALGPGEKERLCRPPPPVGPPHLPGSRSDADGHGPPPHAGGGGPPPPPGRGGPPPHAGGGGHPPHAGGGGPPPPPGRGGPPPHAGGGGPPPPPGRGGPPPHAGDGGPPPHGHGPPPGKETLQHRLPFIPYHPFHRFHPCHRLLTNSDPALHPICPWPHPVYTIPKEP